MARPAGFHPVHVGGRVQHDTWQREPSPGVWHRLHRSASDGRWSALIALDAPIAVSGRTVEPWQRSHWWSRVAYDDIDAAREFLDAHRAPEQIVSALLAGRLVERLAGTDQLHATLDAIAVLIVAGRAPDARGVLAGIRGASPTAADEATRMAWRAGRLRLGPTVVRPATLADVVALLTRTIAGDLPSARARRWAHRWLQLDGSPELRRALHTLVSTGVPQADAHAVAAWQERLEQVRAEVVEAVGTGWPAHLPDVGRDVRPAPSPLPAPVVVPPPLSDRRFAHHAGFCAAGRPPDGRRRVDLFFDHGAFPVWWNGGGAMASPSNFAMPPDLAADLWAWSQAHGRRAVPGGEPHPADAVGWHEGARLRLLAARLERTAGVAAVVQQHRGRGDGSCPTQGCLGPRP